MDEIHSKFLIMKSFFILTAICFGLTFSMQAQDKTYVPNARQAIQKSRMQQPQYLDLTKDTVDNQQGTSVQNTPVTRPVNYQAERPIAIDAPKRRGKKGEESNFIKLAANSSK